MRQFIAAFIIGVVFCCVWGTTRVQAADFRTEYDIEYFAPTDLSEKFSKARYTIATVNLKPDLIIQTFSLIFPKSYQISNLRAQDDAGGITPVFEEKGEYVHVSLKLNNTKAGINEKNTIYLDFYQKNIFRVLGNVWEVIIPTMQSEQNELRSVAVNLPANRKNKVSVAKPVPSYIGLDRIVWTNPTEKTIYAVFGERQTLAMKLNYYIENPQLYKVYTDVAFPPDTTYQQVFYNSISPAPDKLFSDADGNAMGRYYLNPRESKRIVFEGTVMLSIAPRDDVVAYEKARHDEYVKTLFAGQPLWSLKGATVNTAELSSPQRIYGYVTETLRYNYARALGRGNTRMGAAQALAYPDQAVCTEYSDVFIGIARRSGIGTRELQGYAFTYDELLRPISQESDILHSWVEYYDTDKERWTQVDPTWDDTSGIDYYNSLDLNHITFVIHGQKADYPYPAGSYKKSAESRDITLSPLEVEPIAREGLQVTMGGIPLPSDAADEGYTISAQVKNTGNTTRYMIPIDVKSSEVAVLDKQRIVERLLPGESAKIEVRFASVSYMPKQQIRFVISHNDAVIASPVITFITWKSFFINRFGGIVVAGTIGLSLIIVTLLFLRRK